MQSCKHIYRIPSVGRGPPGSLKSSSLFLFLPLSEPPVYLRPNLPLPEEMFSAPSTPQLPFPTHIPVAFQETLGQDLKECKCFTVSCSPETHILGL